MIKNNLFLVLTILYRTLFDANSRQNNKTYIFYKANNTVAKISRVNAVFQPYYLQPGNFLPVK